MPGYSEGRASAALRACSICAGLASAFHLTVITWITVLGLVSAANKLVVKTAKAARNIVLVIDFSLLNVRTIGDLTHGRVLAQSGDPASGGLSARLAGAGQRWLEALAPGVLFPLKQISCQADQLTVELIEFHEEDKHGFLHQLWRAKPGRRAILHGMWITDSGRTGHAAWTALTGFGRAASGVVHTSECTPWSNTWPAAASGCELCAVG